MGIRGVGLRECLSFDPPPAYASRGSVWVCHSGFTGENIRAFVGNAARFPFWVASVHQVRQNSGRAPRPKLGFRE